MTDQKKEAYLLTIYSPDVPSTQTEINSREEATRVYQLISDSIINKRPHLFLMGDSENWDCAILLGPELLARSKVSIVKRET